MAKVAGFRSFLLLMICALAWGSPQALADEASQDFNIPPGDLATALRTFGQQSNQQILFSTEIVQGKRSDGVRGTLTPEIALARILAGSGLSSRRTSDGAFLVSKMDQGASTSRDTSSAPAGPGNSASSTERGALSGTELSEVVVTAQKRSENLRDVPVPVTAISAQELVANNQVRLRDYYSSIPGLSISSNNLADTNLSIRGVTTGGLTNPTVGITVDDVPFGSTTALGSRTAAPDLDPSDLAQIEVLRGPQGTLYGASSLGGLLKYVTVDPSTSALTGRLEADLNGVKNGDTMGFGVRGSANIPLGDTLAVRASGFLRRDPGYLDDPTLGKRDVNKVHAEGARIAALWKPLDNWYLKISGLYQNVSADGAAYVSYVPALGDLEHSLLGRTGGYSHQISSLATTVGGSFAGINLIAISGYSIDTYHGNNDLTGYYGFLSNALYGVGGTAQSQQAQTKKFTQEVRLTGSLNDRLDWLVGGFYTREKTPADDFYAAVDPATLTSPGALFNDSYPTTYAEWAGFADLTVHFTQAFDVQFGARESQNRQRYEETYSGPVFGDTPAYNPPEHTKDNSFTYLVTPRYKFSADYDLMVYGRLASGYRPGGPNPTCVLYPVPCQYAPDKTRNYELGIKGASPEHSLEFDASIYYIDWKNIQLQVAQADGSTYFTNASSAKSQGIELSGRAKPVQGLTVSGWIALNDAKLTTALPPASPVVGNSGDRLPFSGHISGNLALQYEHPLTGHFTGLAGGSLSYVGDRKDVFEPAGAERFQLPGYAQLDLHAGVRSDEWTINLFANNLADRRGLLSTGQIGPAIWVANYIQPRTVGMSVSKSFE